MLSRRDGTSSLPVHALAGQSEGPFPMTPDTAVLSVTIRGGAAAVSALWRCDVAGEWKAEARERLVIHCDMKQKSVSGTT